MKLDPNVHRNIFCQNAPLCSEVLVTVARIELEDDFSGSIALAELQPASASFNSEVIFAI